MLKLNRSTVFTVWGWVLLAMLNLKCLPDEERFIDGHTEYSGLKCNSNGLPDGFQCLWDEQFNLDDDLVRFDIKGIHGTWYSRYTDRCLVFNPDGTGMITETLGATPKPIYWGVMVDSHGNNINGDSPVWRLKIMGENYTEVDPKHPQYHEDYDLLGNYGYQHVAECGVEDVNNTYGSITLWTSYSSLLPIHVTIAGQSQVISQIFVPTTESNVPECSAAGCASFYLPQGDYIVEATSSQPNWHVLDTIHINTGTCFRPYFY